MAEKLSNWHYQQGTTSSSSVDDLCNSSVSLEYRSTWYFSRKDLENNSPSKKDGIDWRRENELRASYCTFIQNMGMEFRVPQLTIATAIMFCHRFYLRQSHSRNNWEIIATVCIFLASKVEETPLSLDKVVVAAYKMIHKNNSSAAQRIHSKEVFAKQKGLILIGERLLQSTIGFDFNVQHPYMPLVATIKKFKLQHDLMKIAWNFVNDWLQTTLCLQYKPHYIAAGSLYLAAKISKVQLPSQPGSSWWYEFDVTPYQLKEVIERMMRQIGSKQTDDLPCTQGKTANNTSALSTKAATAVELSTNTVLPGKEVATSSPDSVITQAGTVSSSPVSTDLSNNGPKVHCQNLSSNRIPVGSSNVINRKAEPKLDFEAIRAKVKRRRLEREAANKSVVSDDLINDILEREIESGVELRTTNL